MVRDLNSLMEKVRNAQPIIVSETGDIEDAREAAENAEREQARGGEPKARTRLKPATFGAGPGVVSVDLAVFEAMQAEAAKHEGETGGVVVGPDETTITELIPSGPTARRSASSFELDAEHLQPILARAEDRGLRFLGLWHVHPERVSELSGTDRRTATAILRDPDWAVERLLLPLSVRTGRGLQTHVFVAEGTPPEFRAARMAVTTRGQGASRPKAGGCEQSPGAPGQDRRRARLLADREALFAAGWRPELRALADEAVVVTVAREGVELVFILPEEYPASPPDVFVRGPSERVPLIEVPRAEIPELHAWSSRRSVLTVAEDARRVSVKRGLVAKAPRRGLFRRLAELVARRAAVAAASPANGGT